MYFSSEFSLLKLGGALRGHLLLLKELVSVPSHHLSRLLLAKKAARELLANRTAREHPANMPLHPKTFPPMTLIEW